MRFILGAVSFSIIVSSAGGGISLCPFAKGKRQKPALVCRHGREQEHHPRNSQLWSRRYPRPL